MFQAKQLVRTEVSVIVLLLLGIDCTFCFSDGLTDPQISLASFKKQLKTFLFKNGDVLLHPSK